MVSVIKSSLYCIHEQEKRRVIVEKQQVEDPNYLVTSANTDFNLHGDRFKVRGTGTLKETDIPEFYVDSQLH